MSILTNYQSFNPQFLKKKTSLRINNQYSLIPIRYQSNNLIIQTPKLLMPFGISNFKDKQYLSLSVINSDNDSHINQFLNLIKSFNQHLIKIHKQFRNKNFINPIHFNKNFPPLINFKILPTNNSEHLTQVYDSNQNKLSLDNLVKNNYLKCIVYIPHLWFSSDNYGYDIFILQIKSYQIVNCLYNYAFIDDEELIEQSKLHKNQKSSQNNQNSEDNNIDKESDKKLIRIKDHPIYCKYFKMLTYGVNIEQIKFKMEMENLDSTLITKGPEFLIDPPNEELSKSNNLNVSNPQESKISISKSDLNQNLKNLFNSGFNLKKTQPLIPKKIVKDVSKYSINLNISLTDILNKISNLKKTNLLPN